MTPPTLPPESPEGLLDVLREVAVQLERTGALERRAARSSNPTLVAVLRGRAGRGAR